MNEKIKCFYAYTSSQIMNAESIESAIESIQAANVIDINSWRNYNVSGKYIIDEVCSAINESDIIICDLSLLSMNVLFELGYAISRNKKIVITLNPTLKDARLNYDRFSLLSSIGFTSYENSYELSSAILSIDFTKLESTIYKNFIDSIIQGSSQERFVFYLKSQFNTESSVRLGGRLSASIISLRVDDPHEMSNQTLSWYAENIFYSSGVVIHLLGEHRAEAKTNQNGKYSLVAGMAYGFQKPLLMLVDKPFSSPVDYRNIIKIYERATECVEFANIWLIDIENKHKQELQREHELQIQINASVAFSRITLGQPIAENEKNNIVDYFIETDAYYEALRSSQSLIYVGRKGTGKTANSYVIASQLYRNSQNHVCEIKLIDYEFEGIIGLLNEKIPMPDQGHLVSSLWKFLIYTELTKSVYDIIISKPIHYVRSTEEHNIVDIVEKNSIILSEFTIRMEFVVGELLKIERGEKIAEFRNRINETLYSAMFSKLRESLGNILSNKSKVCILVDNLDKAWRQGNDLKVLSRFIFGLLSVSQSISDEFEKSNSKWQKVTLSLIVFLRSDIFSFILSEAREADKLSYKRIDWDDEILLLRIIEQRFIVASRDQLNNDEVWKKYFSDRVKNIPIKEYLLSRILPRPRDIIHFCNAALSAAINHQHSKILEEDIIYAEKTYSEYAFNSLIAEISAPYPEIEEILYEFAGSKSVLTRIDIESYIDNLGIPKEKNDSIIEILVDLNFFGIEVENDVFEFTYNEGRKRIIKSMARKLVSSLGQERFIIHNAFHTQLSIKDVI